MTDLPTPSCRFLTRRPLTFVINWDGSGSAAMGLAIVAATTFSASAARRANRSGVIERPAGRRRSGRPSIRPSSRRFRRRPFLPGLRCRPGCGGRDGELQLPECWARMIRLAWSGSNSRVALAPVTTFLPFCSSSFCPIASTRTLDRMVCEVRTSTPRALVASSSRMRLTTSTRSSGRMNPPAEKSPLLSILIATARRPLGRMADMKPPAPDLTSLSRRIGSSRRNPTRVIEPLTSCMAFASADLVIHQIVQVRLWPGSPRDRIFVDGGSPRQVLPSDQHLIDVDRAGGLRQRLRGLGALAASEKRVCASKSHGGDGADYEQSLIHRTPNPQPADPYWSPS